MFRARNFEKVEVEKTKDRIFGRLTFNLLTTNTPKFGLFVSQQGHKLNFGACE